MPTGIGGEGGQATGGTGGFNLGGTGGGGVGGSATGGSGGGSGGTGGGGTGGSGGQGGSTGGAGGAACPLPRDEICNGLDDDCDGVADDGFDLQSDPANCGRCGGSCSYVHAFPACRAGQCALGVLLRGLRRRRPAGGQRLRVPLHQQPGRDLRRRRQRLRRQHRRGLRLHERPAPLRRLLQDLQPTSRPAATCASGACAMGACNAGYLDLNLEARDGCEYRCTPTTVGSRCATARTTTATAPSIDNTTDAGAACGGMPGGTGECRQGSRMLHQRHPDLRGRGDARHRGVRRQGQRLRRQHRRGGPLPGHRLLSGGRHRLRRQRRDLPWSLPAGQLGLQHRTPGLPGHGDPHQRGVRQRGQRLRRQQRRGLRQAERPPLLRRVRHALRIRQRHRTLSERGLRARPLQPRLHRRQRQRRRRLRIPVQQRGRRGVRRPGQRLRRSDRRRRRRPAVPRHELLLAAGRMRQGSGRLHPLRQRRQLPGLRHRRRGQPPRLDLQLPGHGGDRRRAAPTRS